MRPVPVIKRMINLNPNRKTVYTEKCRQLSLAVGSTSVDATKHRSEIFEEVIIPAPKKSRLCFLLIP